MIPIRRARQRPVHLTEESLEAGPAFSTTEIARASAAVLPATSSEMRRSRSIGERSPKPEGQASGAARKQRNAEWCMRRSYARAASFKGSARRTGQAHPSLKRPGWALPRPSLRVSRHASGRCSALRRVEIQHRGDRALSGLHRTGSPFALY